MIKQEGTSLSFISEEWKLCSNNCWTLGNVNFSSFSTNSW